MGGGAACGVGTSEKRPHLQYFGGSTNLSKFTNGKCEKGNGGGQSLGSEH